MHADKIGRLKRRFLALEFATNRARIAATSSASIAQRGDFSQVTGK